jgi:hypothetical protein
MYSFTQVIYRKRNQTLCIRRFQLKRGLRKLLVVAIQAKRRRRKLSLIGVAEQLRRRVLQRRVFKAWKQDVRMAKHSKYVAVVIALPAPRHVTVLSANPPSVCFTFQGYRRVATSDTKPYSVVFEAVG